MIVTITSGGPCLGYYSYYSGTKQVHWVVGGGGIGRVSSGPNPYLGTYTQHDFGWLPDVSGLIDLDFRWTFNGQPVQHPPYFFAFPIWVVTLAPTLLIGTPILIRNHKRRRREQRVLRVGGTPCPSCGYDATGLTTCPECGATMNTHTESQP